MTKAHVRVGAIDVPIEQASTWIRAYVDTERNRVAKRPYAFPANDTYKTGAGASELDDGDLLAPGLLNVPVNLRTFYALQSCREDLASALSNIKEARTLQGSSDTEIAKLVRPLYAVLDRAPRPAGPQDLSGGGSLLGGGNQVYIPWVDRDWRVS